MKQEEKKTNRTGAIWGFFKNLKMIFIVIIVLKCNKIQKHP
jgi:hypothetical protein